MRGHQLEVMFGQEPRDGVRPERGAQIQAALVRLARNAAAVSSAGADAAAWRAARVQPSWSSVRGEANITPAPTARRFAFAAGQNVSISGRRAAADASYALAG
jgi:hypothetical protein